MMNRRPTSRTVGNFLPTSTEADGAQRVEERPDRFEAEVAPDGRIESLSEVSSRGERRSVSPFSPAGIAALARGRAIEYRFDEGRRLRDMPYPDVLDAMRQELLLTAHKLRHGELFDEPEALPVLKGLLERLEATAQIFRQARDAAATGG